MRLSDVDHEEADLLSILLVELVQGGNLPPERRSGVTAEDQHGWLSLREGRELNLRTFVEFGQSEIGCRVAYVQGTRAGAHPHCLEGKNEERNFSGQMRHGSAELLWWASHRTVNHSTAQNPHCRNGTHCRDDRFLNRRRFCVHDHEPRKEVPRL